jgi:hypothetical protein
MSKVTLDALRAALRNDSSVTLDVAALELAALESPAIDPLVLIWTRWIKLLRA